MEHINFIVVFVEGLLSFFSPCVISILPIYLAILSGSSVQNLKEGNVKLKDSPLLKNTILFVLGISTTFFILGSSINAFKHFFTSNKEIMTTIGGILIIIMGLFYLGYLNLPFLQKEKKFNVGVREMKPWTAYLLGFTFSFGWSPCIGPMLASALIMASSSDSALIGNLLILVYTIGFTLPFIIISIFYNRLLKYVDNVKRNMKTIQKIGGAILIITGLVMALGGTDKIAGYFKKSEENPTQYSQEVTDEDTEEDINKEEPSEESTENEENKIPAIDFTLVDQYGETHTLSDYKGKVVFLNFWATWCPPCRMEMPDIEEVYKERGKNAEDVIILGVAGPNLGREGSKEEIIEFLKEEGYTYPVVFDETGDIMATYSIQSLPTTFIIDRDGNIVDYVLGAMSKETMENIIDVAD
ncbi:redoxin domain-containing protein [Anaerosalibacter bizertensis]|uniref:Redoxin domain-containing protein n=1 Tax=Anaerosalibacter bizertensis TaxID=932217 RepID=A0A844FF61_9FIRM|nr:cytochrome c biogenesis protein/redoxin [Anaerosalibacter bizertensis]MBV1816505.1 redoxin family protein [Bacteroidales bacterium MSK.15.36]MCG4563894.1 redoxin family protein [Anaerosalibacter bizertensis]MCG4581568.1 redoxin family protein [Anaerosalibacter bizertensis]MSS42611.1 redoxin domain-containing protein [Anaerosalibacter bizertensis]